MSRRLAALLKADVENFARLMAEDDVRTVRCLTEIRERVESIVPEHRGRLVDFTGDNFLAEFGSALDAVRCGWEIQRVLALESAASPPEERLRLRMGIHLGDVIIEGERVYGDGVNIASRIEGLAEPGGICLSGIVHDLVRQRLGVTCEYLGEQRVKNIPKPVTVYRIPAIPDLPPQEREPSIGPASGNIEEPAWGRVLVDRRDELADLHRLIGSTLHGRGGIALVSGEPGIGKTCLAEEALCYGESQGATGLVGRSHANAGAPAFWPWIELLRGLKGHPGGGELLARFASSEPEFARLFPREGRESGPDPSSHLEAAGAQFRLFDGVARLLREAAEERPLVLLLDDLQWADRASLDLLEFVGARLRDAPIGVVVTFRETESRDAAFARVVLALARQQNTKRLPLGGISREGAAVLVGRIIPAAAPQLVEAIHRRTEGNPFFINEISYHLRSAPQEMVGPDPLTLPDTVREVFECRMKPLSARLRKLLCAASVLGREFRAEVLAGVCDVSVADVESEFEKAVGARIAEPVSASEPTYRFSHALIRDHLYRSIPARERARFHTRAGELLEQRHAADLRPRASDIAYHFRSALPFGDLSKSLAYSELAGRVALSRYAYEEAAEHFDWALRRLREKAEPDQSLECELLLSLAEARYRAGAREGTFEAFREAAAIARRTGDSDALARAALGISGAGVLLISDDEGPTRPLLEEALGALDRRPSPLRVRVLSRLASMPQSDAEQTELAVRRAAEATALARELGDPHSLAFALEGRHMALAPPRYLKERIECGQELVRVAREIQEPERSLTGHYALIVDYLESGDLGALDGEIASHERLAHATQQRVHIWRALRIRAMRALLAGDFEIAERAATEALLLGQTIGDMDALLTYGVQLYHIRWAQGRLGELREQIKAIDARRSGSGAARAGLAFIECFDGHEQAGRDIFDEMAARGFATLPRDNELTTTLVALAETVVWLGDSARARELYDLFEPYRASHVAVGATCYFGAGSYYLGLLAATEGRCSLAEEHFEDAVSAHRRMQARPLLARTLFEFGAMILRRAHPGDPDRGRELQARGRELAAQLQMRCFRDEGEKT
jgi:class 3 adenylate cyclase